MSSLLAVDDHLLVGVGRARLVGGDEGRADVGEVGAHRLRGQDRAAGGDGAATARAGRRTIRGSPATSANGLFTPAWPPAPAATAIRPSAPFSIAFRANVLLMMSCSTMPP